MKLEEIKRQSVPLHAEVAEFLRNRIMAGELAPGEQLPPLNDLSQQMGVARMTVRQAMGALEAEGLIERHSGRGTFVRRINLPKRQTLRMQADLSQLLSMADALKVTVSVDSAEETETDTDGVAYRHMKRIHSLDGKRFCYVSLRLLNSIYARSPERFEREIVVSTLQDIGVNVVAARQRVTISYADFEIAKIFDMKINSPVFHIQREFFGDGGLLIYTARLIYPGDALGFEIEFSVDGASQPAAAQTAE